MNITTNDSQILLALNKPKGYLVTRSDDLGRKTVYNLLPDSLFQDGWMPIGRLDLESKGLLLFTRNGKINDALTKPGNCIKIYEVWVRGYVTDEHIIDARKGVESIHGILKAKVEKIGNGGLSGKPIRERSTAMIKYLSEKSGKAFPIIGVGGIHSAEDALEKLNAGASLIQIYTGFIYEGPDLVNQINKKILESKV